MRTVDDNKVRTTQIQWPEDGLLSDEVLENLKNASDVSCLLCELDDLAEEE